MSLVTEEIRASATEFYRGHEICEEKSKFLLTEVGLPNGLLPLQDIEECGYCKETGFVWLKQKKKTDHKFEKIGRLVQYAPEVTAYVEPNKIKKLTGVKTKELLMWINLSDIYVNDPPNGKITFKAPTGLSRTFPVSAFEIEEEPSKQVVKPKLQLNGGGGGGGANKDAKVINGEPKGAKEKEKPIKGADEMKGESKDVREKEEPIKDLKKKEEPIKDLKGENNNEEANKIGKENKEKNGKVEEVKEI